MFRRGTLALVLLAFLAGGAGGALGFWMFERDPSSGTQRAAEPTTATTTSIEGITLKGVVVLDGAVNGCAGEELLVQVREAGGSVGRAIADSALEGADCVFRFGVRVPRLDCYEVVINGTPVGRYPLAALEPDFDVGFILAESVYGDPEDECGRRGLQGFQRLLAARGFLGCSDRLGTTFV